MQRKITISTKDILDTTILTLVLLYVLVFIWAHFMTNLIPNILPLLMIASIFVSSLKINLRKLDFVDFTLILISIVLFVSKCTNRPGPYLKDNIERIIHSLIILCYFARLVDSKSEFLRRYFKHALPILNVYYVLNMIVMFIQTSGNYFLMDTLSTGNTYYLDMITGFIGADGTHCVALFTVFMIILNLCFINDCKVKYKPYFIGYIALSTIVSIFIATQNDNNALFVLIPTVLIIYFFLKTKINFYNIITKFWKPILAGLIATIGINMLASNTSGKFVDIAYRINLTITSYAMTQGGIMATDERFRLFNLAIEKGGMWGLGWGSIEMFADTLINAHFGMAAIQPMIYMGGWVFYLIYNVLIAKLFAGQKKGSFKPCILLFGLFVIVSYFTQIYIIDRLSYFMAFICIALKLPSMQPKNKEERKVYEDRNNNVYVRG